ncbi:putative TMPIT-like protein [Blattamonas nauphoetae]|uniref:TMPIT-like protein n=1 Tax=Blattamonas nauphoetae TaxID=2049346 RepID=A0ABQ9XMP1_9EUKA|nr:putative TMPIT-like protein [Blattamonas nauphoetae]
MSTEIPLTEDVFQDELEKFRRVHEETEEAMNKYKRILKEFNNVQENVQKKTLEHRKQTKTMRKVIKFAQVSPELKAEALQEVKDVETTSNSWRSLFPSAGAFIVKLLIGGCNLRMFKPDSRQAYKMEYNTFRTFHSYFIFIANIILLLVDIPLLDLLYFIINVYFYFSFALREHILKTNGSHIRTWWILHHYLCVAMFTIYALYPRTDEYVKIRPYSFMMGIYEGIVHFLQARYQRHRVYTLITLRKIGDMEVPNQDSTPVHWNNNMIRLLPFLLLGDTIQLCYGTVLMMDYFKNRLWSEWQLVALGLVFLILAFGNTITTLITFFKSQGGKKVKYIPEWSPQFFYGTAVPSPTTSPVPQHGGPPPALSPATESVDTFNRVYHRERTKNKS